MYAADVKPWRQGWLIAAGAYPGFCSIKRLEVFLLPLDRMLVHRRSLPRNFVRFPQQIAGTHLYTWVERGTVKVKCLAQEHNTLSPARARTRTARSGVEHTNHEATAPPTCSRWAGWKQLPVTIRQAVHDIFLVSDYLFLWPNIHISTFISILLLKILAFTCF